MKIVNFSFDLINFNREQRLSSSIGRPIGISGNADKRPFENDCRFGSKGMPNP